MSKKQTSIQTIAIGRCLEWPESFDGANASAKAWAVIPYLLLNHPDQAVRDKIKKHLGQWIQDVSSPAGIADIIDCSSADDVALLSDLRQVAEAVTE